MAATTSRISSALQPRRRVRPSRSVVLWVVLVVLVGVAARFAVSTLGYNYDFESYQIVARIMANGGNVYQETFRYNYGPAWFNVLHLFQSLASNPEHFRLCIIGFLTLIDLAIAGLIVRRYSVLLGCIFFLNPISIIITGFHNQFDNLAIALALAAVMVYEDGATQKPARSTLWAAVLLGASLIVKHIFFLFPLWLFLHPGPRRQRLVLLLLPYGLFLASFLPYVAHGYAGIIKNVLAYVSSHNAPLLTALTAGHLSASAATYLFMVVMLGAGMWFRRFSSLHLLVLYVCTLVVFSPAIANQYYVIPILFILVFPNFWSILAGSIAALMLVAHPQGLDAAQRLDSPMLAFIVSYGMYAYVCVLFVSLLLTTLKLRRQQPVLPHL